MNLIMVITRTVKHVGKGESKLTFRVKQSRQSGVNVVGEANYFHPSSSFCSICTAFNPVVVSKFLVTLLGLTSASFTIFANPYLGFPLLGSLIGVC